MKGLKMTELETLKKKKKDGKATPEDLTRLKLLQDGEPLSASDLKVARKREEDRKVTDKADYKMRQVPGPPPVAIIGGTEGEVITPQTSLDIPPDHPRIMKIKEALMPFTQIEAHDSRPDEFVLFNRGINITAGDVRKARKAMKL